MHYLFASRPSWGFSPGKDSDLHFLGLVGEHSKLHRQARERLLSGLGLGLKMFKGFNACFFLGGPIFGFAWGDLDVFWGFFWRFQCVEMS